MVMRIIRKESSSSVPPIKRRKLGKEESIIFLVIKEKFL